MIALAPKCVTNYLNTNDSPFYLAESSQRNKIKRFVTKMENLKQFFFFLCKRMLQTRKLDIRLDVR